jgi:hypothetical protein
MITYRLYAGSPENSCTAYVQHPRPTPYKEATLQRWFEDCLTEAGRQKRKRDLPEYRNQLAWSLGQPDNKIYVQMYRKLIRKPDVRVEDVFGEAVELFCTRHGFKRVVAEVAVHVGAWDTCYPKKKRFGR